MRKRLLLAATLTLSTAFAQTIGQKYAGWNGDYTFQGCTRVTDGVRCDFSYAVKSDQGIGWGKGHFAYVDSKGATHPATKVSLNGQPWSDDTGVIPMYTGIPVKISALFDTPRSEPNLRILFVENTRRADNVPVTQPAAAPAPAPVQTAPAVNLNAGTYTATLTNCKASGNNTVICTATLTPRK